MYLYEGLQGPRKHFDEVHGVKRAHADDQTTRRVRRAESLHDDSDNDGDTVESDADSGAAAPSMDVILQSAQSQQAQYTQYWTTTTIWEPRSRVTSSSPTSSDA